MNYKERYNAALERARKELQECVHKDCDDMTRRTAITIIRNLFPELKESEDEKVRKALIELVKYAKGNCLELLHKPFNVVSMDAMLAWLEKQGKKLDPDKVIGWLNDQACLGWIEDVEVNKFVEKFKKDFGLCHKK